MMFNTCKKWKILEIVKKEMGISSSKARQLLDQGAVSFDGKKIDKNCFFAENDGKLFLINCKYGSNKSNSRINF